MKIESIITHITTFSKALDFSFMNSPSKIWAGIDWDQTNMPSILDLCTSFAPHSGDEPRFFKKIIDAFQTRKHQYIRGTYMPFSNDDYYKIAPDELTAFERVTAERVTAEEFYEEKVLVIDNTILPRLESNLKTLDANITASFILKRSIGNFNDGIDHPYYYQFAIDELIPIKHSDPKAMDLLKQFLLMLEFKMLQDNIVYFSIVKTTTTIDVVRQYAWRIEGCKSRAELQDTFYKWNEVLAFVQLTYLQERYLNELYNKCRAKLPA